jgi:hypothetical protein
MLIPQLRVISFLAGLSKTFTKRLVAPFIYNSHGIFAHVVPQILPKHNLKNND